MGVVGVRGWCGWLVGRLSGGDMWLVVGHATLRRGSWLLLEHVWQAAGTLGIFNTHLLSVIVTPRRDRRVITTDSGWC